MAMQRLPIIGKPSAVYIGARKWNPKPKFKLPTGRYVGRHRKNPSIFKPFGSWF